MNGNVGLGAASSVSTIQSLIASMNSNWKTYTDSAVGGVTAGNCWLITNSNGLTGIQQALADASQVVPMFASFGGYAASYARQAASAVSQAQKDNVTQPTNWANPCIDNQYISDVSNAVSFAQQAYSSLTQQIQQLQQSNATSLSIPAGGFGVLTIAVLGWQYSARPIPAQVQGMLAGSWPQASGQFQSANLSVSNVVDTGRNDLLGNPIYTASVSASGSGTVTAYPASKAGSSGAGYSAVLCGSSQWCLGVISFQQVNLLPISPGPPTTPAPSGPPVTLLPITLAPPTTPAPSVFPSGPPVTFPIFTTFPPATPPSGGATTPPTPPTGGATPPPVGFTPPGPATMPHAGATPPPAGTSSTGSDVLIGVAVTAGLAAVGAGIMWFAHRQHERELKKR
jgi:hypothetical protein